MKLNLLTSKSTSKISSIQKNPDNPRNGQNLYQKNSIELVRKYIKDKKYEKEFNNYNY